MTRGTPILISHQQAQVTKHVIFGYISEKSRTTWAGGLIPLLTFLIFFEPQFLRLQKGDTSPPAELTHGSNETIDRTELYSREFMVVISRLGSFSDSLLPLDKV